MLPEYQGYEKENTEKEKGIYLQIICRIGIELQINAYNLSKIYYYLHYGDGMQNFRTHAKICFPQ